MDGDVTNDDIMGRQIVRIVILAKMITKFQVDFTIRKEDRIVSIWDSEVWLL